MQSNNLNFMLLALNQSKKEVTVNEALVTIDAILNNAIIDIEINTPPKNPQKGDLYGIGVTPENEWGNHNRELAFWHVNSWNYIKPKLGLLMWIKNRNRLYVHNGQTWAVVR